MRGKKKTPKPFRPLVSEPTPESLAAVQEMTGEAEPGAAGPARAAAPEAPPIVYKRARMYPKQEAAFFNDARWALTEGTTKCFMAGTLVATARGHRPIESVVAGDEVLSWDGEKYVFRSVLKRFDNPGVWDAIRVLTKFGEIVCSKDHEFRTDAGWVAIGELARRASGGARGDSRKSLTARCLTESDILGFEEFTFSGVLHDLMVEETHNYCVTRENISVHNSGKTSGLVIWLCEQAVRGKEGQNFWWIAPVAPTAAIAYRRMVKAIPYNLRTTHDTLQRITLVNGTHIWFKGSEKPDNLFGEDVYAAVVDEASRVREESWHALRTTLSATKGPCRIIGNVKGRRNWFYKLCRKAEAGERDMAYSKLTWRDAVAAGILDEAEINDARAMLPPNVFRELYEAEAGDDQGNPFGLEAIAECVAPQSTDPVTVWGQDFARKHDWNVGVGLDRLGRVAALNRFQKPWREAIADMVDYLRGHACLCDSTGVGDVVIAALQEKLPAVEGYWFTQKSKQMLMEHLAIGIQQRKVKFPEGPIRDELESFEYVYTRTGVIYSAPEGCYDDCVCALALAWLHHQKHGGGSFVFDRVPERAQLTDERGGISRDRVILI